MSDDSDGSDGSDGSDDCKTAMTPTRVMTVTKKYAMTAVV